MKENTAMNAAILCMAMCVYDVMNKVGTSVLRQQRALFCSSLIKSELTWLRPAGDGEPMTSNSSFTQLLSSDTRSALPSLLFAIRVYTGLEVKAELTSSWIQFLFSFINYRSV